MKTIRYMLYASLLLALPGCKEKELEPISPSLGKPGTVVVDKVVNIAGGAEITYTLPQAEDVLYVQANYVLADGKVREIKSSMYNNTLTIEGYNDQEEHIVKLYAVNRAQELSDPIEVTIRPEESPLQKVVRSMEITPDFGGARFSWENPTATPISIEMMAENDDHAMSLIKIYPTASTVAYQSLRGYDPEPRVFAAIVRDNWGNVSDTLFPAGRELTPVFEEQVPSKQMSIVRLLNDGDFNMYGLSDTYMIDGDVETFGHNSAQPSTFTIDMGSEVMLSRMKMWYRYYSNAYFCWGNPRYFTVYGRVDPPSMSGDWDEWTKIMDCEAIKPSGIADQWTETVEDVAEASAGLEFEFEYTPTYRYIRIEVTETWGMTIFAHPAEVTFYGKIVK